MGPSIDSGYSNRSIVLVVTTICLYFVSLSNAAVHSSSRNIVRHRPSALLSQNVMEKLRAGAEDEYDEEYDMEGEYDSEEMDEIDEKLSKAAEAAMEKARKKRAEETKAAIASSKVKATKKKKGNMLKILRLPYVIRAFLNPFTVAAMTKHYFASLFNVNYLEDQVSFLI